MSLSLNSHQINMFNDFILNKIPKNEYSLIKLIDVGNFIIIKGFTTYCETLNMFDLISEFKELHNLSDDIRINTIDLLEYSSDYKFFNEKNLNVTISTKYKLYNL